MKLTEQEFADMMNKRRQPKRAGVPMAAAIPAYSQKSGSKHGNVLCEADNLKFPSKKHRQHYLLLKAMQYAGEIKFFLREVAFDLPGHYKNGKVVRHFVDFQLVLPDWTVRWQEVKGRDLGIGKMKRAQTEEIYGIKIEVIK